MRLPGPVARAGQLCAGDQLSCPVAQCGADLGEVGGHCGGLDVGEGLGGAGLVGVSDDGDPGQMPGEAQALWQASDDDRADAHGAGE